jgi:hypothetical protein
MRRYLFDHLDGVGLDAFFGDALERIVVAVCSDISRDTASGIANFAAR